MANKEQELPLITRENCQNYIRGTIPTSWRCEPITELPDPDTPIFVFDPNDLAISEPYYIGNGQKSEKK